MTTTLVALVLSAVAVMAVFAAYWMGRDSGERSAYEIARIRDDLRTEKILSLQLENERLKDSLAHPTLNVWNNERVPDQSYYPPVE